ncbi:MAG: hypothetical protein WAQ08_04895 [Aquabacterium sp.]|uniref:LVIVD repeat-containing protein n=1 Tax=Aquabacterium sp. TaxID=1872578 RepID=UPI003BB0DF52
MQKAVPCLRPLIIGLVLGPLSLGVIAAEDQSQTKNIAVTAAQCGPGSRPETGLQGEVPLQDRQSGRSKEGYSCNLELVGQYQGEGAATIGAIAGNCAYMPTSYLAVSAKKRQGVQVIDVSNPSTPRWVKSLDTRAFHVGTWESLKVNEAGTMLAGAGVGILTGSHKLDLYDIRDCANPKLLNKALLSSDSQAVTNQAHEGEWSPDGRTYWTTSATTGTLSAIDISNPSKPQSLYFGGSTLFFNHGMSFNDDGTRMYLASVLPAGIVVLDVSDIQNRKANPKVRQISKANWNDGSITQKALPVKIQGRPHLIVIDEFGGDGMTGGIRFIDISDETKPVIVSHIRLAIQLKENANTAMSGVAGTGFFNYDAHYCTVDRKNDPTALACGYFQSGIRVFDIRDHLLPREIAYFNPPAQTGRNDALPGSDHAMSPAFTKDRAGLGVYDLSTLSALIGVKSKRSQITADWCSSPPKFVNGQLWTMCNDNGFMVLKFTNGAYPLR